MIPLAPILLGLWAVGSFVARASPTAQPFSSSPQIANSSALVARENHRPFYATAHRVLTTKGAEEAVKMGANAIEIDCYAYSSGWWADHDGTGASTDTTVYAMFRKIVQIRQEGADIVFVWLDIKNPLYDYNGVNIASLKNLAREILQPAGIRVLYGFFAAGSLNSNAYIEMASDLNYNEALGLDGERGKVMKTIHYRGPQDPRKRVYSTGYFNPGAGFGDCSEEDTGTCSQLIKAREKNQFNQIFSWTITNGQYDLVKDMVHKAEVDGIIFGFVATHFYWHDRIELALGDIRYAVERAGRKWVTNYDIPWKNNL